MALEGKARAIRRRLVRPGAAVAIMAIVALGATAAPASAAGTVEGRWRSTRQQGRDSALFLTLDLLPGGAAELYNATVEDDQGFLEAGTWRLQGSVITVLVFEPGQPPSPNELVLEQRGDNLVPVKWNPDFYGNSPPAVFVRQPQGEPAP